MSMLRLKTYMVEPQGGWSYPVTALSIRVRAGSFNNLVQSVRCVYKNNNMPIPENLSEIIEDHICRNTARVFVANPDAEFLGMVTLGEVYRAVADLKADSAPCAVDETESRSQTCRKCDRNVPTVCITCNGLDDAWRQRFSRMKLNLHPELHICQVDAVPACVATAMRLDDLTARTKNKVPYPEQCWKRRLP